MHLICQEAIYNAVNSANIKRGIDMTDFKTWFEQKYIDWLAKRGRRGSLREFSEWLGVSQSIVANWMGGHRKPGPEYADIICAHLDYDLTIYDLLDMPRPDTELLKFKFLWPTFNERERAEVGKIIDKVEKRNAFETRQTLSDPGTTH
jgi:hypothetical protein